MVPETIQAEDGLTTYCGFLLNTSLGLPSFIHRPLAEEPQVLPWNIPHDICGGQRALGEFCLRVLRLCPFSIIPPFSTLTLSGQARKPRESFNKGIQFWISVSRWSTAVLWYGPVSYLWRCFPLQLHFSWLALRDL